MGIDSRLSMKNDKAYSFRFRIGQGLGCTWKGIQETEWHEAKLKGLQVAGASLSNDEVSGEVATAYDWRQDWRQELSKLVWLRDDENGRAWRRKSEAAGLLTFNWCGLVYQIVWRVM